MRAARTAAEPSDGHFVPRTRELKPELRADWTDLTPLLPLGVGRQSTCVRHLSGFLLGRVASVLKAIPEHFGQKAGRWRGVHLDKQQTKEK